MKTKQFNYFVLLLLLTTSIFYAQSSGISYQAVIYKPDSKSIPGKSFPNSPLVNTAICLRFTFWDSQQKKEYQEIVKVLTDNFGIVSTIIGTGTQIGGYASSFYTISWSNYQKTLQVELDVTNSCSNFEEISSSPLTSSPFSFSSTTANNVTGIVAIANGGTGANTIQGALNNLSLGNVDNTSDLNKPISIATQNQLNSKEDIANKSIDINLDSVSDSKYPSVKAVKTYVDNSKNLTNISLISDTSPSGTTTGQMAYNTNPLSGLPLGPIFWNGTKWQTAGGSSGILINTFLTSDTIPSGSTTGQMVYNTNPSSGLPTGPVFWNGLKWQTALEGKLDMVLVNPAIVATTSVNTLAITGLRNETSTTNQLVSINPTTGVLSRINMPSTTVVHEAIYMAVDTEVQFTTPIPITDILKVNVFRNGIRIAATMVDATHVRLETGIVCNNNDEIRIVQYE